jgi:hypothetical protein
MVAVMEFFFSQQASLQAIYQRKHFSIGHFVGSKEKRPPANEPTGVICVQLQNSQELGRDQDMAFVSRGPVLSNNRQINLAGEIVISHVPQADPETNWPTNSSQLVNLVPPSQSAVWYDTIQNGFVW